MLVRYICLINLNFGSFMSFKVFIRFGFNNYMYLYNFRKLKNIGFIFKGYREELYRFGVFVFGRLLEIDGRVIEGYR